MKTFLCTTVLATGAFVLSGSAAAAQEVPDGDPAEVDAGVAAPVLVCPVGVAIGGDITSDCPPAPGAPTPAAPTPDPASVDIVDDDPEVDVDAPVNVCPIGVALDGDVDSDCPEDPLAALLGILFPDSETVPAPAPAPAPAPVPDPVAVPTPVPMPVPVPVP